MKNYCVYMHTNRVNGKRYIGITGQQPEKRWLNGAGYRCCPYFSKAIDKYGWDAFQHEILYSRLTQAEAANLEAELIAKYKTTDRAFGYNASPGGVAPSPTPETREKIRTANLGKTLSKATRAKLRALALGRDMPQVTREKISRTMKGRAAANRSAVVCMETGRVYQSMEHAARDVGVARPGISLCCHGRQETAGGYHWRFSDGKGREAPASGSII